MNKSAETSWDKVPVSDFLSEIETGVSVNSENRTRGNRELGILKTSCISRGKFYPEEHKVVLAEEVERVKTPLKADSILMSRMNTPNLVGEVGYVKNSNPEIFLPDRLWMFSGKDGKADTLFLSHLFSSGDFRRHLGDIATGTSGSMKNIPQKTFLQILVDIPPLLEQKKIAEILSGIDNQINLLASKEEQAKKAGTALAKQLISSVNGDLLPLSEVVTNYDSRRVPIKSIDREGRRGPYRYFGASGVIDMVDDYLFDGEFILVGEDGANIIDRNKPLAFRVAGKFWVNNHAHVIQPNNLCDLSYLEHYLESLDYTGIASGSAQPKITRASLDSIQIPIPPIQDQIKIGAVIDSAYNLVKKINRKKEKLLSMKSAISSDLLSGRKRVSV